MLRRRAWEKVRPCVAVVLGVLWAQGPGAGLAQEDFDAGLEVGSISELDLEAVSQIINLSDDSAPPSATRELELSLEQAVELSLEQNLGLQVSFLEVESSQQGIRANKSKFHPVVEVEGGAAGTKRGHSDGGRPDEFTRNEEVLGGIRQQIPTGGEVSVGVGYSNQFTDENYQQSNGTFVGNLQTESEIAGLGIEIVQPLLKGGRIFVARKQILDAEYDNEISRAELNAEILKVTADTKTAYYRVIQTIRAIEVVEEALVRDEQLVRASRALFEAGRVSKVDVYSAEINQANDLARLASAEADGEIAQNNLREILGLPIDVGVEVTDRTIPFEPIQIELDRWIELAVERRPELVRAQVELEKADLEVRVRKNDTLPSFDVGGGFEPGFDWESWNWNARGEFRYPIGNVAARSRLKQANLSKARLRTEYVRQKRKIELEVREIEIRLRQALQRLKNLVMGVESARSKRDVARGRFEMGLASNLDIRNADEELILTETALLEGLVGYASNLALLEASIGGPTSP